jgi:hypothetical protein
MKPWPWMGRASGSSAPGCALSCSLQPQHTGHLQSKGRCPVTLNACYCKRATNDTLFAWVRRRRLFDFEFRAAFLLEAVFAFLALLFAVHARRAFEILTGNVAFPVLLLLRRDLSINAHGGLPTRRVTTDLSSGDSHSGRGMQA